MSTKQFICLLVTVLLAVAGSTAVLLWGPGRVRPAGTASVASAADARPTARVLGDRSFEMPALWVMDEGGKDEHGTFSRLPFRFERTSDPAPLRVLLADDTPSGTGAQLRSSVWMAAAIAALERNDPLDGVRVTVEFSGESDGPSIGGMLCLAMLSALDGRDLPKDFAMTGTILPDGTVGTVGGVAVKLRAAFANGIRRVCIPAFLRYEKQSDGSRVDLFRLGEKEGAEVRPVLTVAEAYAYAHGLPLPPPRAVDESAACALPRKAEDALRTRYEACIRRVEEKREKWAPVLKKLLEGAEYTEHLLLVDDEAERAFETGRLFPACEWARRADQIWSCAESWAARRKELVAHDAVLDRKPPFSARDRKELLAALRRNQESFATRLKSATKGGEEKGKEAAPADTRVGYYRDAKDLSEIAAQAEDQDADNVAALLLLDALEADAADLSDADEMDDGDLADAIRQELRREFVLLLARKIMDDTQADDVLALRASICRSYPRRSPNGRLEQAERMFHSAWKATAEMNAVQIADDARDANLSGDAAVADIETNDVHSTSCAVLRALTGAAHNLLDQESEKLTDRRYHAAAVLVRNANVFADACALLVKYGSDLGGSAETGDYLCVNGDFLNYLVRRARIRALEALDACARAGVPCPAAVAAFQAAESVDVVSEDRENLLRDMLANYWRASLVARALLMGFGPQPGV